MDAGFVLVTERKSAALEAIEVEGTRHLLAKPIPRLSDSLGTERERMPLPVSCNSVSGARAPGRACSEKTNAQEKRTRRRKRQLGDSKGISG